MKKALTLIFFLTCIISLNGQQISSEQRTLLVKKTATWCPPCGGYGWNMMKGLMNAHDDEAIVLGMNYAGKLASNASKELSNILPSAGQPTFFLNHTNLGVTNLNIDARLREVNTVVEEGLNSTAGIGIDLDVKEVENGDLELSFTGEFNERLRGTWHVTFLIVEDSVLEVQTGRTGLQYHPNVLRESIEGIAGKKFAAGWKSKGDVFTMTRRYTPNPDYNRDQLKFAAIIWENNFGELSFVNGIIVDEIKLSTDIDENRLSTEMNVTPNILEDIATVSVVLEKKGDVELRIVDIKGNQVAEVYSGSLNQGKTDFTISKGQLSTSGLHFVHLITGNQINTQKLIVR